MGLDCDELGELVPTDDLRALADGTFRVSARRGCFDPARHAVLAAPCR